MKVTQLFTGIYYILLSKTAQVTFSVLNLILVLLNFKLKKHKYHTDLRMVIMRKDKKSDSTESLQHAGFLPNNCMVNAFL